ncbi:TVP38/TMEM64 family protein [uncultured Clostridium sp.]|uniref:TVP38/TMEM64 family protein n=1 Tax=uncultured Clostridium sp. TaxID=59620 RepID=UPI00261B40F6|nr:TVP38/TMEM64 family protein [uncultured Clostridium sp.]
MRRLKQFILLVLAITIILLFLLMYQYNVNIKSIFTGEQIKIYILSFGIIGPLIVILICIIAEITTIIPSFLVVFAATAIYGWEISALITWIGYTIGAGVGFMIAKFLGREFVEKLEGKGKLSKLDKFLGNEGFKTIFIARLLPFIPFNLTSYLAGLSSISFKSFILGTAIGQIPGTIAFAVLGEFFIGDIKYAFLGITIFISLILISMMFKKKFYK